MPDGHPHVCPCHIPYATSQVSRTCPVEPVQQRTYLLVEPQMASMDKGKDTLLATLLEYRLISLSPPSINSL